MKFDMDYIAHHNALTESNPYFKLFLTIILLIVTLALDNLNFIFISNRFLFLWALTDSNRRPSACKADALNQLS